MSASWDLGSGIWDLGLGIWELEFGIWDAMAQRKVTKLMYLAQLGPSVSGATHRKVGF